MDVKEAIWTTRAMRHLDSTKPVSDEDLWTIIEAASKGPGRDTTIRWIVVRDQAKRAQIGEIYRTGWLPTSEWLRSTGFTPKSGDHLGDHFGEAPVIIVPIGAAQSQGASIFGQIQNLFLQARALGLGTTLTTSRGADYDAALRAVLEIPEEMKIWALIPLGYPTGRWGEAKRQPVEELAYWDGYGQTRVRT